MLGENHSLVREFPEMKDKIAELAKTDDGFATDMKTYDNLDKEIRKLELKDSPIDDGSMHQLKHDRSVLKDALYARLNS
ncbi:YdcH family protein [Vibrio sp. Isolate31]|uniref:YdcH family protein n=1 Tax=unclassified Vibrio TaxID=2614977 RepID=UPI001EFE712A|nr:MULTISPECIES: YdcH family protein [unclassified Vibrio]MCG9555736.1 YdcH family protein [Vibrio sp. Isolate32]MCG9600944.1 YdcH family protein [Vibrio sp. Isolate31]